ncbi:DUF1877 family protein [Streptomyces hokutonensis]|uniref:DUF1877 family protein n=1 Tax=Streptomyces hokutonensis TaxID=1306990 RepID=UPI00369345E9
MPLTQQFARVTSEYLDGCRAAALAASDESPGWDPPDACLLDTDWAIWGLIHHCRSTGADPQVIALLDRAVTGDPDRDVEFLNHEKIYDGFGDPPRLLTPTAVTDVAAALDRIRLDDLLSELPTSTEEAATACGFGAGFEGDVRAHLTEHFVAMREFYRVAAHHAQCVVTWVD